MVEDPEAAALVLAGNKAIADLVARAAQLPIPRLRIMALSAALAWTAHEGGVEDDDVREALRFAMVIAKKDDEPAN